MNRSFIRRPLGLLGCIAFLTALACSETSSGTGDSGVDSGSANGDQPDAIITVPDMKPAVTPDMAAPADTSAPDTSPGSDAADAKVTPDSAPDVGSDASDATGAGGMVIMMGGAGGGLGGAGGMAGAAGGSGGRDAGPDLGPDMMVPDMMVPDMMVPDASPDLAPDMMMAMGGAPGIAPAITSNNSVSFSSGTPGTFKVTTTGSPTPSIAITGGDALPSGISFVDNHDGTGTLSGTSAPGTSTFTFTATNTAGTAMQSFTLYIVEVIPPLILTDDKYTAVGNTQLVVGTSAITTPVVTHAGSVLDNDFGPGSHGTTFKVIDFSQPVSGAVEMDNAGHFVYTPNPNVRVDTDTFQYQVQDSRGRTDLGTVTIDFTDGLGTGAEHRRYVWYVDGRSEDGTADGRSNHPFHDMGGAGINSQPFEAIFVHDDGVADDGQPLPLGGISLQHDQTLWGQGVPFVLGPLTIPATGFPTLTGTVVVSDNTIVSSLGIKTVETAPGLVTSAGINIGPVGNVQGAAAEAPPVTMHAVVENNVFVNTANGTAVEFICDGCDISLKRVDVGGADLGVVVVGNGNNLGISGSGTPGSGGTIVAHQIGLIFGAGGPGQAAGSTTLNWLNVTSGGQYGMALGPARHVSIDSASIEMVAQRVVIQPGLQLEAAAVQPAPETIQQQLFMNTIDGIAMFDIGGDNSSANVSRTTVKGAITIGLAIGVEGVTLGSLNVGPGNTFDCTNGSFDCRGMHVIAGSNQTATGIIKAMNVKNNTLFSGGDDGGAAMQIAAQDSGEIHKLVVSGNTTTSGAAGIAILASEAATIDGFSVAGNTVQEFESVGIQVVGSLQVEDAGKLGGTIGGAADADKNTVGSTFQGSVGIQVQTSGLTSSLFTVQKNAVTQPNGNRGLDLSALGSSVVQFNVYDNTSNFPIIVSSGEDATLVADIKRNTAASDGVDFQLNNDEGSTFVLLGNPASTVAEVMGDDDHKNVGDVATSGNITVQSPPP